MAQITSSVGLISGINTGNIINELISIDAQPITLLQSQISSAQNLQTAYSQLETSLTDIQNIGNNLALPQTFQNATATSSDNTILTANASVGAAVGSYTFQVPQLVTTQQTISSGFTDSSTALVGAGTITLEEGGGEASSQTPLAALNGGAGVTRGQFRITDRSGNSAVVSTANAISLDDVVTEINSAQGINVKASISNQGLVLTDVSGGSGTLSVQDVNGGTSAKTLGIASSTGTNTLTGSNINYLTKNTALAQLNDNNGVSTVTAGQNDFSITTSDGTVVNVSLNGARTVGDVINAINTAGGAKVNASISPSGTGLTLTDTSGGAGTLSVTADNSSTAAAQLGLTQPAVGTTVTGSALISGIDSVLISSLKGGSGLPLGTFSVTDRGGVTGTANLANATSVSDIINDINNNTGGARITASLNAAGTGIQITDNSGGNGNLTIADTSSTSAAALGIAGTFGTSTQTVVGSNLQHQYVSANTQLSAYNGGQGVAIGQFRITNSDGASATIDLSQGTFNTIGNVLQAINSKNIGVTASINANGNGILLTDTAGGSQKLSVTDLGNTTAANLNIASTATGTTIDGAEEKTITVTNTDTLSTLQGKINQAGFGVSANIINDGSASAPFRLALTAVNSGRAGRVVIDSGTTNLNLNNLVDAQDAAVFFGGSGSSQPLLITSSTNQLNNIIKGVSINLVGASSNPVTLNVAPDTSNVTSQLAQFTTDFNTLITTINTESNYNTTNNEGGILLGDGTTQTIQETLYNLIGTILPTGKYNDLADIGISIQANASTTGATLQFNTSTFEAAFASNPSAVQGLFSQGTNGFGTTIANAVKTLTDPVSGVVTIKSNSLTTNVQNMQDQITNLNQILANKRLQLETEFNNMELAPAQLQSESSLLSAFNASNTAAALSTTSSSSGSSSSSSNSSSSNSSADSSSS